MSQYTKGDWKVLHNKHGWHCDSDGVGRVCMIDTEANANLIAAAPDLYEALKLLAAQYVVPSNKVYWELALAALAKADGM